MAIVSGGRGVMAGGYRGRGALTMGRISRLARDIYEAASDADRFLRAVDNLDREHAGLIKEWGRMRANAGGSLFDQGDVFVIAYGDQFHGGGGAGNAGGAGGTGDASEATLPYLHRFLDDDLAGAARGVHILPFCPYSSDEGFSVTDYMAVNPALGEWRHIDAIAQSRTLMVDLVCNHCSVRHRWFRGFLSGDAPYDGYFITARAADDLSQVFRPRTSPLLHSFSTAKGERRVWTTFSADQVDLNYANPRLLAEMVRVLFQYIRHGARVIRLDAVAYLWKEVGTPCIHHPKTHAVIRLLRALLEERFPGVLLITETNVPHNDNISYFGNGADEAHMVYNFSLPPLTLEAMIHGDATHLTAWARTLSTPSKRCAFFNFLASHDGIGLLPAGDYLTADDMEDMIAVATERGGRVSYKQTAAGAVPYELNINYLSAISDPQWSAARKAQAFLTAQAIMCSLAGVPAPYIHSVIGSENWNKGLAQGLENRSINRQRLAYNTARAELATDGTVRHAVFEGYKRLLQARAAHPEFHPNAPQQVLELDKRVFALRRGTLLCAHNTSGHTVRCALGQEAPKHANAPRSSYTDILTGEHIVAEGGVITLAPYQSLWLE